jgi:hypothetical protein
VSRYEPAELIEVANHDGSARLRGDRFFALPDDEDVGDLISASTSIPKRKRSNARLDWILGALVVGLAAIAIIGSPGHRVDGIVALVVMIAFTAGALWLLQPPPRCSYVGTDGVNHAWKILRLFPRSRTLRFSDAVSCELKYTRVWQSNYRGTNMRVTWRDANSRVVFEIDTAFREYRIDRDETDLEALGRCATHELPSFAIAAIAEFRKYQRWDAAQDA